VSVHSSALYYVLRMILLFVSYRGLITLAVIKSVGFQWEIAVHKFIAHTIYLCV
jgi:hypothetical protein